MGRQIRFLKWQTRTQLA